MREAFKKWTLFWIVMVCVLFGKVDYLEANFTKYKNGTSVWDGKIKFGGRIRFRQEIKDGYYIPNGQKKVHDDLSLTNQNLCGIYAHRRNRISPNV